MGRDTYYECHTCGTCSPDHDILLLDIPNYGTLLTCRTCADCEYYFSKAPSEFVDFKDDDYQYRVPGYRTLEGKPLVFSSFKALATFIGENETKIKFGLLDAKEQQLTDNLDVLRKRCEQLTWLMLDRDEENTVYTPTRTWWEKERERVKGEVETWTKRRKILDESLLSL